MNMNNFKQNDNFDQKMFLFRYFQRLKVLISILVGFSNHLRPIWFYYQVAMTYAVKKKKKVMTGALP